MKRNRYLTTRATALSFFLMGCMPMSQASAAEGAGRLLCALVDVVACTENGPCLQGSTIDFDVPSLLVIDFDKGEITGHKESGSDAVSPIRNHEKTEKQIILQGVENHRGWTLAIDREDYSMALTSSGSDINMMMFGSCTAG